MVWNNSGGLPSRTYVCGYCGNPLASNTGYAGDGDIRGWYIYICHQCYGPTFFDHAGNQTPGAPFGGAVADVPTDVESLYNEARNCTGVNAHTASVLCCRKLLMNIAVSKGAPEGQTFIQYVEFLSDNNYVPPDGKEWVDHIRTKGNEATHEIAIMKGEDAEELITFIEMLLRFIYEFPATIKKKKGSGDTP
jgi:hypothetical protein